MGQFDPWATSSGLPDDFTGTIVRAWFEFDDEYNNGETLVLKLETETEDIDLDKPLWFPCGNGWDTPDNGKTAEHPRAKMFNKMSAYGAMITRCIGELGMGELLHRRGLPTAAEVWIGLTFHWNREKAEFTIDGEKREGERLLPSQFIGEGEAGKSGGGNGKSAASAGAVKPSEDTSPSAAANGDAEKLRKKVVVLAKASKDFETFVDKAVGLDGVADHEDLVSEIIDEESGIWSQVKG